MSHFTVLVIGENVEEQLEPFWELDLSPEEKREDPRSEFRLEMEEEFLEEKFKEWENKYQKPGDQPDRYKDAKTWAEEYHGYEYSKECRGYGYYQNPNAKWDWYVIGGRWSGFFALKEGREGVKGEPGVFGSIERSRKREEADQARKGDIDFEYMLDESRETAKISWAKAQSNIGEGHFYDIEEDDTFESYVNRQTSFSTFAILNNGKWYEKGDMGWWGIVSNEKSSKNWHDEFEKLIESLPDDTLLTIVDCHI